MAQHSNTDHPLPRTPPRRRPWISDLVRGADTNWASDENLKQVVDTRNRWGSRPSEVKAPQQQEGSGGPGQPKAPPPGTWSPEEQLQIPWGDCLGVAGPQPLPLWPPLCPPAAQASLRLSGAAGGPGPEPPAVGPE